MNINFTNLLLITAVVLSLGYIYYQDNMNDARMNNIDNKIDSLEQCIDIKQHAIDSITICTNSLMDSIARIDTDIEKYKSQLQEVKNKYAKIKPTNTANAADVTDFFSDRYSK